MFQAGVPCHVISRGNNRQDCFINYNDYLFYLKCLNEACLKHNVALHAYVLMTNHVHLLFTPSCKQGISKVMQSIGRRYVYYFNKTYQRTGTLWEGRFKARIIDAERYLLSCYRYIELNPVRANMVATPGDYLWSSYGVNAGIKPRKNLSPHPLYQSLASDENQRHFAYQALFNRELTDDELNEITS
ncbi:transposase [Thalassotalea sp. PLHSN55]|uniref:transposase n=1 Tax=Thalassotalea sp. PLHSN55 TaxID=3435888 RepID=UPI003F84030A